jgi:hypothetical protein
MSVLRFILVYLKGLLLYPWAKRNGVRSPQSIVGYKLLSVLRTRPCLVAIYQNKAGKKALVKIWQGSYRDAKYYAMAHEILMHSLLAKVLDRVTLPRSISAVRIPKLIHARAEKETLVLVREYVEGNSPRRADSGQQIATYNQVVDFMRFIGAHLTPEERRQIPLRKAGNLIVTFPLIAAYACLRYPGMAKQICRGAPSFVSSIPTLLRNAELLSLAHKDLHLNNIVLTHDGVYVIDLENCTFINPMYEYVTTLATEWGNVEFRDALIRQISDDQRFRDTASLCRGLALYRVIHGMSWGNSRPPTLKKFGECLQYAASLTGQKLRGAGFHQVNEETISDDDSLRTPGRNYTQN